jgi:hypothetical protein
MSVSNGFKLGNDSLKIFSIHTKERIQLDGFKGLGTTIAWIAMGSDGRSGTDSVWSDDASIAAGGQLWVEPQIGISWNQ